MIRLLAVSGSLRARSTNTALLDAAASLAPEGVRVERFGGLAALPHFDPDADDLERPHPAVAAWRSALREADGVLFSCPEYAFGVPGVLKNALDWLVGSGELQGKPVLSFNASPRASAAQESLLLTLRAICAPFEPARPVEVPLLASKLDASGIAAHPGFAATIRGAIEAVVRDVERARADELA
jgi:NAD(P)H-dependent FMN reductase